VSKSNQKSLPFNEPRFSRVKSACSISMKGSERIVKEGDQFAVLNTSLSFSEEEIVSLLILLPKNFLLMLFFALFTGNHSPGCSCCWRRRRSYLLAQLKMCLMNWKAAAHHFPPQLGTVD
jgi:hypothetical protein